MTPTGDPVIGEVGELVLTRPMPSMPVGFWNDPGRRAYRASYFAEYPGVWRHGDWIMFTARRRLRHLRALRRHPQPGRRPDGHQRVLPGRGTAAGGPRQPGHRHRAARPDGRLSSTWCSADGSVLDDDLTARIRPRLRSELSPRHVPDEIHQVPGIPRTLSGKKLEVPVRKILLGTPLADAADPDALANPEVLALLRARRSDRDHASGRRPAACRTAASARRAAG